MRIALVIDHLDACRGGAEGYISNLTKILLDRGHEVHVFANSFREVPNGAMSHHLPMIDTPRGLKVASLALAARIKIKAEGFDIVKGFGATWAVDVHRPGGGVERAWLKAELESLGRSWSGLSRGLFLVASARFWASLLIEEKIYRRDDLPLVIANSQMVARQIICHYPFVNRRRLKVVMNPVDSVRFHPENRERFRAKVRSKLGIPQENVLILFVAHNFRLKGLGCLLQALEGEVPSNYVLVVVGRGKAGRYRRQVARVQIPVLFLGPVEGLEELMGASDLLVHPTFYDPCANVVLEAMASGIPVITTRRNGCSQLIEHGVSGYVLESPWNIKEMREFILAMGDSALRWRIGEAGRKKVEPLTWQKHAMELEGIYREAVELKREKQRRETPRGGNHPS